MRTHLSPFTKDVRVEERYKELVEQFFQLLRLRDGAHYANETNN